MAANTVSRNIPRTLDSKVEPEVITEDLSKVSDVLSWGAGGVGDAGVEVMRANAKLVSGRCYRYCCRLTSKPLSA